MFASKIFVCDVQLGTSIKFMQYTCALPTRNDIDLSQWNFNTNFLQKTKIFIKHTFVFLNKEYVWV